MYSFQSRNYPYNLNGTFSSNLSPAQAAQMRFEYHREYNRQERNYSKSILREYYPTKFVIVYSCLIISIGLSLIIMQIVYYASDGVYLNFATGIWAGFIYVVAGSLAASVIKWKLPTLMGIVICINFFAIFSSLATILFNSISLSSYEEKWLFANDRKVNQNMKNINIAMIVLASISLVTFITYFVVLGLSLSKKSDYNNTIEMNHIQHYGMQY